MEEKIFNLFLFISDGIIKEIGAFFHKKSGNDESKLSFLQSMIEQDLSKVKRYPVPKRYIIYDENNLEKSGFIRYQSYQDLALTGNQIDFFEEIFEDLKAPKNPLMCITPVVDGKLIINGYMKLS